MYCSYAFNAIQKTKTLTFLLAYTEMIVDETSDTVLMNLRSSEQNMQNNQKTNKSQKIILKKNA